jgi:hypothetical protein
MARKVIFPVISLDLGDAVPGDRAVGASPGQNLAQQAARHGGGAPTLERFRFKDARHVSISPPARMNATSAHPTLAQNREILRQGMRASVIEGVLATPVVTMSLPVNIFMTALVAKGFPLSKPDIGGVSSLPFACNFLQVFITPLVTRWARARPTAIIAAGLHTACWAWLGLEAARALSLRSGWHRPVPADLGVCRIAVQRGARRRLERLDARPSCRPGCAAGISVSATDFARVRPWSSS